MTLVEGLAGLVFGFVVEVAVDAGVAEAEAEGGVAEDLVEVAHVAVVGVDVAECVAGRGVDVETLLLA